MTIKEPVKEAAKEPVKEAAKEPVKEAAKEPKLITVEFLEKAVDPQSAQVFTAGDRFQFLDTDEWIKTLVKDGIAKVV